jgi:iron complex outermembrane recepter protein
MPMQRDSFDLALLARPAGAHLPRLHSPAEQRPQPERDQAGLRRPSGRARSTSPTASHRARVAVRLGAPAALVAVAVSLARVVSAQPAPRCAGTVEGRVVDDRTHEPVIGAIVLVNGRGSEMTDEAGRFAVRGLCPGSIALRVEREGYAPGTRTIALTATASLELRLRAVEGEVIVVQGENPEPIDMRSTAKVTGEALERTRGRDLSDTLAEVPGVSQLRSASGMAKPIVRGQYGRRLLLLVDSTRHRSQDWGIDHAPEVDPFVADEISVVRGASGVRYGPDAIGGAVLVEPPELPRKPGVSGQAHAIGLSNGFGGALAGRVQGASRNLPGVSARVEGSMKHIAAPATPDYPLDNTGSSEWNVGAAAGYRTGDDQYKVTYDHYQAQLGVCTCLRIDSSAQFFEQFDRKRPVGSELYTSDFEVERPYQAVVHDHALARGRWGLDGVGTLTATYSFQQDHRREYEIVREATTGPQFNFRLYTHDVDVGLEHRPIHPTDNLHLAGSVGAVGMIQDHQYSGLPLVPDHQAWSAGAYVIERLIGRKFEVEAGLRYDYLARSASILRQDFLRLVRSGQLAEDACGTGEMDPVDCSSKFHTVSASIGGLRQITTAWSIKLDLSTASRPPNPDEQYLNGTSPTFPVLGLGKPDLGPETTYSASATTSYQGDRVTAEASAFANHIDDYIYFAPAIGDDGEPIFDVLIRGTFPRFVTRPVDAVFYGADGGIAVAPVPFLELGAQLSLVRARNRTDDSYLVFVPPDRLRGSITFRLPSLWGLRKTFASVSGTYTRRQDRFDLAADFSRPPGAYFLLGAEAGTEARVGEQTVKFALQGTNLLDVRYRDYTSLLRYFADQPGWQLLARFSVDFDIPN